MSEPSTAIVREFTELFSTPLLPPDPRDADGPKKAAEWNLKFNPHEDCLYEVELDYAYRLYEETNAGFDRVDEKGELLFKFTAFSAGAIPTVSKSFAFQLNYWAYSSLGLFLLGLLFLLIGLYRARKATPVDLNRILDYSTDRERHTKENLDPAKVTARVRGFLAASIHVAIAEINEVIAWKSRQLARASWTIILGLAFGGVWLASC